MLEIKGTFNTAQVFIDTIDATTEGQIRTLCELPFLKDSKIRIMPDVHAGKGCTIGTTMTIHDCVVPNMVGVDIGCGMETIALKQKRIELPKLDSVIRNEIPAGMNVREHPHRYAMDTGIEELRCIQRIREKYARQSIGTLGGGNHFIEVDKGEDGTLYLVVHSGSRHLGVEVAEYYQSAGYQALCEDKKDELIARLQAEGRQQEIQQALKDQSKAQKIPKILAYVQGKLFDDYIHDMRIVQRFAQLNRHAIADTILRAMKLDVHDRFTTVHNYIDTDAMILRKGAISAREGERMLIPINMRDGSLICTGKGNDDWNQSAPHGAGRLFSRTEARNRFTVNEFKKEMNGIFTTSVNRETLDECPMAYKRMEDIVQNITPTAEINDVIRPIYNFKAGEE